LTAIVHSKKFARDRWAAHHSGETHLNFFNASYAATAGLMDAIRMTDLFSPHRHFLRAKPASFYQREV